MSMPFSFGFRNTCVEAYKKHMRKPAGLSRKRELRKRELMKKGVLAAPGWREALDVPPMGRTGRGMI
jgi:hypothetical protein